MGMFRQFELCHSVSMLNKFFGGLSHTLFVGEFILSTCVYLACMEDTFPHLTQSVFVLIG